MADRIKDKADEHAEVEKVEQDKRAFPQQVLRGGLRPTDAKGDWVKPNDPDPSITDYWVDVYDGPRGIGWVANYEKVEDGKTYVKRINYGPETERDSDWTEVVEFKQ